MSENISGADSGEMRCFDHVRAVVNALRGHHISNKENVIGVVVDLEFCRDENSAACPTNSACGAISFETAEP